MTREEQLYLFKDLMEALGYKEVRFSENGKEIEIKRPTGRRDNE